MQPFLEASNDEFVRLPFMQRGTVEPREVPVFGMDERSMGADAAYRVVKDEINLDGNPVLNLAGFITTRMDPQCEKLIMENLPKNFVDHAEYPQTSVIESKCVLMLRRLFNAPEHSLAEEKQYSHLSSPAERVYGCSTVGSSEAIHLGALNMKWNWARHQPKGSIPHLDDQGELLGAFRKGKRNARPNLVFPEVSHVCWHKFCRYFDVEQRHVPIAKDRTVLDVEAAISMCDENTIGVVAVLGSTHTGEFDDVERLNDRLEILNKQNDWRIPIHVDGASGALIASLMYPQFKWDFRLKWVKSINVSGHKYGMVYPGIGWVLFRTGDDVHRGLVFEVDYLGAPELTLTLNFSKGASHILAQYYQFLRLGKEGYRTIFEECMRNAAFIESALRRWENDDRKKIFRVWSHVCEDNTPCLPVIVFSINEGAVNFDEATLVKKLRERGWILPASTLPLPSNEPHVTVIRIVVRETLSEKLTDILLWDIHTAMDDLQSLHAHLTKPDPKTGGPPTKIMSLVALLREGRARRTTHAC